LSTIESDVEIDPIDTSSFAEVEDPSVGEIGDGGADIDVDVEPVTQPNVLNLDEYGDYVVDLGGEYVPVSELKGGGLRQADYTRKTQELADLRREAEQAITLQRAMQVNPEGTLQWLAQQHGLTIAQAQAMVNQQAAQDDWWDDEPVQSNPLEQRLAQIEQRFQAEEAEKHVTQVFHGLKAKYGDDFNEQEVAKAAVSRGIYDPNMLEMVYRDLAYEKITAARSAAMTEAQAKAQAEEQRRRQAAAQAAAATSASGGAVGTETPAPSSRNLTVREAAELAWSQLYGD
jgi:hypothetical protein